MVLSLQSQHVEGCRTIYDSQASPDFIMESYLDEREQWSEGEEEEEEGRKGKKGGEEIKYGVKEGSREKRKVG